MKKLLIAALAVSVSAPLLAAPAAQSNIPPTKIHTETHAGGFYQDVVFQPKPAQAEPEKEEKAVVATTECAPLWGGAKSDEQKQAQQAVGGDQKGRDGAAIVPVPDGCAGLGLARPLYGNMSVGAAVGIGAAVVAVGAALSNHGGGHHTSGTTGTK